MDYKIIQIIPNNVPMVAQYKNNEQIIEIPISIFALIEYEDGERAVYPMDLDEVTGEFCIVSELSNFIGANYL